MSILSTMGSLLTSSIGMFFRRDEFFDDEIGMASRKRLTTGFFLLAVILITGAVVLGTLVGSLFTSAFDLYSNVQVKFIELQIMYSKQGLVLVPQVIIGFVVVFMLIALVYIISFQLSYWWARLFGGEGDRLSHHQVFLTAYLIFNFILMIATPFAVGFFNLYDQKSSVVIFNFYLAKPQLLTILRVFAVAYLLLLIYMVNVFYRGAKRLYDFETPLANGGTALIALLLPIIITNGLTGNWLALIKMVITGG